MPRTGMKLYGYLIYENLEYKVSARTLLNIKNGKIKRLGKTKARLLDYILDNAGKEYITDEDIFIHVFEDHGLRCSKSYLWAMIRQLHFAFLSVGYERAPIFRHDHKGYIIRADEITEIYIKDTYT